MLKPLIQDERGTSAVFMAFVMVFLLGIAAIVVDATGAGFNERRQDQTASDTGVMSGALGFVLGETDVIKVQRALEITRSNLDTEYGDADWQAAWESCADPDIGAVDVGLGVPRAFTPMPNPFSVPGTSTLQCVSSASSFMRVVVPDQLVPTTFGKVLGFDSLSTHAEAVARVEPRSGEDGLLPFGIPGGVGNGEVCLSTNPSGPAQPPCQGPSAGGFGSINSEFFGDFFGTPSCSNPGASELAQNIALGIDHFVDVWPSSAAAAMSVTEGDAHPGDVTINGYTDVSYDQCRIAGGVLEHQQAGQGFPPNTFRIDTGFPATTVEEGLISDNTFLGQPSRLQNTSNPTQNLVKRRTGANNVVYPLDDVGPWDYLVGTGDCASSSYASLTTDQKVELFQDCLEGYSGSTDIFDATIEESPRFAWAPQYWHAASTSGTSWQPVVRYRMVFLGGLWFNCTAAATPCGVVFYPDTSTVDEMCQVSGGGCALLNLDQLSAWVLPDEAIPDSVSGAFPGGPPSPFQVTLFR